MTAATAVCPRCGWSPPPRPDLPEQERLTLATGGLTDEVLDAYWQDYHIAQHEWIRCRVGTGVTRLPDSFGVKP